MASAPPEGSTLLPAEGATAPASWLSEVGAADTIALNDAEEARVARMTEEPDGMRMLAEGI